ncbi:HigA family addiction module antidote protein, partial [bacterium]|nr:HigA family addiction module antidote protein [bacterium]
MDDKQKQQYNPDYVSAPGETLEETIVALSMNQSQLAERMGRPKKTVNEIIKGVTSITPDTALQLEKVLGVPASFWNNREKSYREYLARLSERRRLESDISWTRKFPIRAMTRYGWIKHYPDKAEQVNEMLSYFSVASKKQWEVVWKDVQCAFRRSKVYTSDIFALTAWLRRGELLAVDIDCADYDLQKFKEVLKQIRTLAMMTTGEYQKRLRELCSTCGVAVAFVPSLPKTRVSGATRWLSPRKALIQLSLRHKTDDHLWFSFFHEAAHIILHGKKDVFIEGMTADADKENEADVYASNMLIPRHDYNNFVKAGDFSEASIIDFAKSIELSPSIVVGR